MRIALIGTRGAPARYGGFETAVEEIGARLADAGHRVVVYCRNPGQDLTRHRGMELVNLPAVHARGLETLSHSFLSVLHQQVRPADVAVVFNAANAPLIPILHARRMPVAVNVDGVEWRRSKWGPGAKRYYRRAEAIAVRAADALIADARGIQEYYRHTYGRESVFIPYGTRLLTRGSEDGIASLGVRPGEYHLVVARFEPENNLPMIVRGYLETSARYPLLVIGDAQRRHPDLDGVISCAGADPRLKFGGAVWDQDLLDRLYVHSSTYVHGHSVGGTNPSLLRAMGAGAPVIAFDVNFNREVLADTAGFFADHAALAALLEDAESNPEHSRGLGQAGRERAGRFYNWDRVASEYESLCRDLVSRSSRP